MNNRDILFKLLHRALEPTYPISIATLKEANWEELFKLSYSQGLHAIVFDAITAVLKENACNETDIGLGKGTKIKWIGTVLKQEAFYGQSWKVANKLADLWKSEGITATLIKGRAIAQCYPKPEHRYSCDLDIFIKDKWDVACAMLERKGIKLEYEVYKEAEFTINGVYVECHRYITPVRGNRHLLKVERYLRALLSNNPQCFESSSLVNPCLEFTALLFVEHALRDLLHGKFSLKHIVDWMVMRKQLLDWKRFHGKCEEFKFLRFLSLIDALADVIEGKRLYEDLPVTYKEVLDKIFLHTKLPRTYESWFMRRVQLFFDILKCRKAFSRFGYCSVQSFLLTALWSHFTKESVHI